MPDPDETLRLPDPLRLATGLSVGHVPALVAACRTHPAEAGAAIASGAAEAWLRSLGEEHLAALAATARRRCPDPAAGASFFADTAAQALSAPAPLPVAAFADPPAGATDCVSVRPSPGSRSAAWRLATVAVAVAVTGLLGWAAYELIREPTPREVAVRFARADTVEESSRHATPRLQEVLRTFKEGHPDHPEDRMEVLDESPGPGPGRRRIAFQGAAFDAAEGRVVTMTGWLHLVRGGRWLVDDMTFERFDTARHDPPLSLVDEFHRQGAERANAPSAAAAPAARPAVATTAMPAYAASAPRGASSTTKPASKKHGRVALFEFVRERYGVVVALLVMAAIAGFWNWARSQR